MRMALVGRPRYRKGRPSPQDPAALPAHDCIGLRPPTHGGSLGWEFGRRGKAVTVQPEGRIVLNATDLVVDASLAGLGLAWVPANVVAAHVGRGRLVALLDDRAVTFPGYRFDYAMRSASPAVSLVAEAQRAAATRRRCRRSGVQAARRAASTLKRPGPVTDNNRKMKQNRIASSPPFWIGVSTPPFDA